MYTISNNYETHIVQQDHPSLRAQSQSVSEGMFGTKQLEDIIHRMTIALEAEPDGVAIACPQIGENWRIFIVHKKAFAINDADEYDESLMPKDHFVVINPELTKFSKKQVEVPEGCLSVRWLYGTTTRYEKVTMRYQDEDGKKHVRGGSGLMAQIFQHETDHLNGILFHDHAKHVGELSPKEIAEIKKTAEKLRSSLHS